MTQAELNREVARVTGESVGTIQRLGFLLAEPDLDLGDAVTPYVVDWDAAQGLDDFQPVGGRVHGVP